MDETIASLREDDGPLGITDRETVCPSCHLVYNAASGSWGVCSDCFAEGIRALPV